MRLTLRTLLAYLDQTLEPQDAEMLGRKIEESGFATELVARVRRVISDGDLAAPAPDAVSPLEDANVIGEYLDSTLTPEQIAEIERACLESDAMLSEAAACHQILTMVLDKPLPVPAALRARIQAMTDGGVGPRPPSYSSLSIPPDPAAPESVGGDPAGPDSDRPGGPSSAGEVPPPTGPVTPVGPADSGVSDAPTRIREKTGEAAGLVTPAASRRPATSVTDFYGGSIRPSRIAPWLVSIALAAVLLFALAQIFVEPLMNRRQASDDVAVVDVPASRSPDAPAERTPDAPGPTTPPRAEPAPAAMPDDAPGGVSGRQAPDESPAEPRVTPPGDPPTSTPVDPPPEPMPEPGVEASAPERDTDPDASPDTQPDSAGTEGRPDRGATETDPTRLVTARLLENDSVLIVRPDDQPWRWWNEPDTVVPAESTLICPPFERVRLMAAGNVEVTLIGPTRVRIGRGENGRPTWRVEAGRLRLTATAPDASLRLAVPFGHYRCAFPEAKSEVSVEVTFRRDPGLDPRVPENREPAVAVTAIGGAAIWTALPDPPGTGRAERDRAETDEPKNAEPKNAEPKNAEPEDSVNRDGPDAGGETDGSDAGGKRTGQAWSLETGAQWRRRGDADAKRTEADPIPAWADADPESLSLIETTARDGLRELIGNEPSFEMSLREAIAHRRVEVGALAARTLLLMGMPDVYFGGDGVLNQDRQRNYWAEHVEALRRAVDRDAEAASQVDAAIQRMASAERDTLFRLLVGFTQQDLESGADEALVAMLDSPSMAIRVLAIETLRQITGTSLYYKAWESNPTRRSSDIKRWQVRLRRDMIRWPQDQPAVDAGGPEPTAESTAGVAESIDRDAETDEDASETAEDASETDEDASETDDGASGALEGSGEAAGDEDASATKG